MSIEAAQNYFKLIEHDQEILRILTRGHSKFCDTSDWQVTLLYYVLRLYLKALARCRGKELQDHYSIKQWLNSDPDLLSIARSYRKAEEWSRDARYEGRVFSLQEKERFAGWFSTVRDHARSLLIQAGAKNPPSVDPGIILGPPA